MKRAFLTVLILCLAVTLFASCGKTNVADVEESNVNGNNQSEEKIADDGAEEKKDADEQNQISVQENEFLSALRQEISDNGAKLGVAYLGYNDGTLEEIKEYVGELGFVESYPFIEEISSDEFVENDSNELYLVVPASKDETVRVYDAIWNNEVFELEKANLLCEVTDGKPFLLLCNISEIVPNVIISTDSLDYSPCLSGMDGTLVTEEEIYDFSPYEEVLEYFGIANGADSIFCGSWFAEEYDAEGELMSMYLNLNPDESAEYVYGIGNGEIIQQFEGTWSVDADTDMIVLDLFGGSPDEDAVPFEMISTFKWDMDYREDGTYLILEHEEGDALLLGLVGATTEFADNTEYYE